MSPLETLSLFKHPSRMVAMGRLALQWYSAYFEAQRKASPLATTRTDTVVDERIPIDEKAIYPYLFAGLYLTGCAGVLIEKLSAEQFELAIGAYQDLIVESERMFLAHPTRLKTRLQLQHPLTRFLQSIDGPTNCFPSMHVALVTLTFNIFRQIPGLDASLLSAIKQSCIDICRATLATRQHGIIDVIGGIALAGRIFKRHFAGSCEELLEVILPELEPVELADVRALLETYGELPDLLNSLVVRFQPKLSVSAPAGNICLIPVPT